MELAAPDGLLTGRVSCSERAREPGAGGEALRRPPVPPFHANPPARPAVVFSLLPVGRPPRPPRPRPRPSPIRSDRAWILDDRRLAWWIVLVRHCVSDFVRFFTTRLPIPLVYALCYPLTVLGMVPGIKYLTFSIDPDFQARLIENFDWISPPYQWHHTKEELSRWFGEEGFTVVELLPHGLVPKPGALGRKDVG